MITAEISPIRQTKAQIIRKTKCNTARTHANGPHMGLRAAFLRAGFFLREVDFGFAAALRRCATRGRLPDLPVMFCLHLRFWQDHSPFYAVCLPALSCFWQNSPQGYGAAQIGRDPA